MFQGQPGGILQAQCYPLSKVIIEVHLPMDFYMSRDRGCCVVFNEMLNVNHFSMLEAAVHLEKCAVCRGQG